MAAEQLGPLAPHPECDGNRAYLHATLLAYALRRYAIDVPHLHTLPPPER